MGIFLSCSLPIVGKEKIYGVCQEEKHIVHDPDEQQHHDHTTNEAVGGVVLAEVVGVEG